MKQIPTHLQDQNFSFADDSILETLKKVPSIFAGSATSDFQSEPLRFDPDEKPIILSDWELNVWNNVQGKNSSIVAKQNSKLFPSFLKNRELYFKRSADLGQTMFRLSLDFPRLCPKPFQFDENLMREYAVALMQIKFLGQEPMIALYHWPMPLYLLEIKNKNVCKGGWEHPDVLMHIHFYAESILHFLNDKEKIQTVLDAQDFPEDFKNKILSEGLCNHFITINEPNSILFPGYIDGSFPPYKKVRFDLMPKVLKNLVQAHDIFYGAIKKYSHNKTHVGVAHSWPYFDGPFGWFGRKFINEYVTNAFERDGSHTDFLGMQYYFRLTLNPFLKKSDRLYGKHPGFGDAYPRGILQNLKKLSARHPNKPIIISEFGFPNDAHDMQKPFLILETVRYMIKALQENIPIKGILIWTLVNNLEWAQGMDVPFGFWNEDELKNPMQPQNKNSILSFQAWRCAVVAITHPTREHLQDLQAAYVAARTQFQSSYR